MTSRADWLEARRKGIGSTDAAIIMGTAPHGDQWSLWLSKTMGVDDPGGEDAEIGRWLERPIIEWAAQALDLSIGRAPLHVVGPDPWMLCTPDAWLTDGHTEIGLDAKATDRWASDQMQWFMLCTGRPVWLVAEYVPMRWSRRIHTINADPERQALMRSTCWAWWQRHVVEGVPPEVDGSAACSGWLRDQHAPGDRMRRATTQEIEVASLRADLDDRIGELDQERARLDNWLRRSIGDDGGLYFTGGRVKRTATNRITVRIDP